MPSFAKMYIVLQIELLKRVINNNKCVLRGLLPQMSVASQNYNLPHTRRKHCRESPCKNVIEKNKNVKNVHGKIKKMLKNVE